MFGFDQVEALGDQLRHLLLNPPLAPGAGETENTDPLLLRYLPLLVIVTMFWPVLVTLIAASFSASAWLFWLCVGLLFGALQLLYVLYNFTMIIWDLSTLTLLKTFAMLRSFVRYYFYKMTDAAGIERKRKSKKRRRKEWREEVDRAADYKEYCSLQLFEPQQQIKKTVVKTAGSKYKSVRRIASSANVNGSDKGSSPGKSGFGMKLRKRTTAPEAAKKNTSLKNDQYSPTSSPMRKIQSSHELNKKSRRGSAIRNSAAVNNKDGAPLRRVSSSAFFSESFHDEDDTTESCPKWQQVVKEDLGMAGSMLLTTMSRLKEARLQASSMKVQNKDISGDQLDNRNNEQEEGSEDDNVKLPKKKDDESSFHITSFSSKEKRQPIDEDYSSSLKTLLSGIVKRNHLSVDDFLMEDARSVAERGQHSLKRETREAIDRYGEEVQKCMDWVASGAVYLGDNNNNNAEGTTNTPEQIMQKQREELSKRYTILKRMKQNMGHTALMLSGGGAQAMYHLGTIKALVESELYQHIHVISGTSGGSISAAMCAIKLPHELLTDICVNTVSTDYMRDGSMGKKGVSWFPSLYSMGSRFLRGQLVMDSKEFLDCCQYYYSDITFEEAFEMTRKHVCITVSASRASSGSGVQRLLLNHISTPNVTLASAVATSCAVPGIMAPRKLMMKDRMGNLTAFEVDGVEWIDGSVQADLPFKRISTLFNISNFVVAQTNFHVAPFLNKAHHPGINTLYWKLFQMCMWDARSRVMNLSQLGLFPRFFGQDLSKMFNQKYHGKLTLVPRFTTSQLFGLKVLSNPTVADMTIYLRYGQLAAWPFLRVLREMLRIESSVDESLAKLDKRIKSVSSGFDYSLPNDDIDSLSSAVGTTYRAHLPGLGREAEQLKEKVRDLEQENKQLRQHVVRLQRSLGISPSIVSASPVSNVSVSVVEEHDDESPSDEKKEN